MICVSYPTSGELHAYYLHNEYGHTNLILCFMDWLGLHNVLLRNVEKMHNNMVLTWLSIQYHGVKFVIAALLPRQKTHPPCG